MKPADLVHKDELDPSSKQKKKLRPALALSRATTTSVSCLSISSAGAPELQSQPGHSLWEEASCPPWLPSLKGHSGLAAPGNWLQLPKCTKWQRKQKLCRLQALGTASADDRKAFGDSEAGMMATWKPRRGVLKGTPQERWGSILVRT